MSFYRLGIRHASYIAALQSLAFVFKHVFGYCSVTPFSMFYVSQLLYVFYTQNNRTCSWTKVANNIHFNVNTRNGDKTGFN